MKLAPTIMANLREATSPASLSILLSAAILVTNGVGQETSTSETVPVNKVIATVKVGRIPQGVAVAPDSSTVYVANSLDNTVSVINASTNTIEKSLFAGSSPEELAISSDGSKLYISNHVSPGTVTVLDLANGGTPQTITGLDPYPIGVALSPDGKQLWVAAGNIDVIDTNTSQLVSSIPVSGGSTWITITPDGLKAFACTFLGSKFISVIDTTSFAITATIATGYHLGPVVTNGQNAYVLRRKIKAGAELVVINTMTDKVSNIIQFGSGTIPGNQPAFLPGRPYLYVPISTPSAVAIINTRSDALLNNGFSCSSGAYDVAVAPDGNRIYVTDEFANRVTVVRVK